MSGIDLQEDSNNVNIIDYNNVVKKLLGDISFLLPYILQRLKKGILLLRYLYITNQEYKKILLNDWLIN